MNKFMNSSALIMRPKPEFLEWMSQPGIFSLLPADKKAYLETQTLELMRANATIISIPLLSNQSDEEIDKLIDSIANNMLETELERWSVPASVKPPELNSTLLRTWFDVTCHPRIFFIE